MILKDAIIILSDGPLELSYSDLPGFSGNVVLRREHLDTQLLAELGRYANTAAPDAYVNATGDKGVLAAMGS